MSIRTSEGTIQFEAPVSTMAYGSLERSQGTCPLLWPGQQGMTEYPLDQLSRRMYERDRISFFCRREILFHGKEVGNSMRAASLDPFFGVKMRWPYEASQGERYVFTFEGEAPPDPPGKDMIANDLELPDAILINNRLVWERPFGSELYFTVEYIAPENGPMDLCLIKDARRCRQDAMKGWGLYPAMVHTICRGYIHLHLGLRFACEHFGPVSAPTTIGRPSPLPEELRTFVFPGVWKWVPNETVPDNPYPPLQKPDYPTDGVRYNQFHDLYLDDPRFAPNPKLAGMFLDHPERLRQIVRLSWSNGIRCFPTVEPLLKVLEEEGLQHSEDLTIFCHGKYIKRVTGDKGPTVNTQEGHRAHQKEEGHRLAEVMRRFPKARVIYRMQEFSGCQYYAVINTPEDRARTWPEPWYRFSLEADAIYREALDTLLEEARSVDPDRISVACNVQSAYLDSHALHCGADFNLEKTIGRNHINILMAHTRGVNQSFGRLIGMQHDAWGGLNYNRDSAREIESLHRSFFFNGADFHDAEFCGYGITQQGEAVLNQQGLAWIRVTRLAALHPRRGQQQTALGFLWGNNHVWGWYYPTVHTMGPRDFNHYDPADPKEYIDFDLLDIAFPKFGRWFSTNPDRWMTGTPLGPVNLVPADAPQEALNSYAVLPMLGSNVLTEDLLDRYTQYVRQGGTLVLGLYQLLAAEDNRTYLRRTFAEFLGLDLGEDIPLWDNMTTLFDRQFLITKHYNRVHLKGAEVLETIPGTTDPLLTRFALGDGYVYFFTTDRLCTVPDVARNLLTGLMQAHAPLHLSPEHDYMETTVSAKGDLRLVTLMDHGRDALPTDAGLDTGPYCGTLNLNRTVLGLPDGPLEMYRVMPDALITRLDLIPVDFQIQQQQLLIPLQNMDPWLELAIGPKGQVRNLFFES